MCIGRLIQSQWIFEDKMLITCKILRSIDLRYGMKNKISLPLLENIWALVEFHYRTVPFRIFWVFSQKFQKKPKKLKWYSTCILPRFGNFRASVEFHFRTVPFRIFRGRNETARWMVEILQVLNFYCNRLQQWLVTADLQLVRTSL